MELLGSHDGLKAAKRLRAAQCSGAGRCGGEGKGQGSQERGVRAEVHNARATGTAAKLGEAAWRCQAAKAGGSGGVLDASKARALGGMGWGGGGKAERIGPSPREGFKLGRLKTFERILIEIFEFKQILKSFTKPKNGLLQ